MEILSLYFIFLKIGLFTIGGGLAMLPLMQKELVAGGMMTLAETVDMVAISQMTPGPFAINAATFAGMNLYGIPGAAAATLGVVTPSLILTMIAARFFIAFSKAPAIKEPMSAIRPVVAGLILAAALGIASDSLLHGGAGGTADWPVIALAAISLVLLLTVKKLSPIVLIAASGVLGAIFLRS